MKNLTLRLLPGQYSICQGWPANADAGRFTCVIRTEAEISIVCRSEEAPADLKCESGWRLLKIAGVFEFSETGVLAAVLEPLARHGVPILALSTFSTDLVLIKQIDLARATAALESAGHVIIPEA